MEQPITAVLFDLDGVLVSTDEFHYQAWKAIADGLHIPFDRRQNDRLRGVSRMESLELLLEGGSRVFTRAEKLLLAEEKNKLYRRALAQMTPEYLAPAVLRLLQDCRALGLKLAVGSSSRNAPEILQRVGLGGWFDAVVDGSMLQNAKPDPEVFLQAAALLDVPPQCCLVVEDAVTGIEAGVRAGMRTAAVGSARRSPLATVRLEDVTDLLPYLRENAQTPAFS